MEQWGLNLSHKSPHKTQLVKCPVCGKEVTSRARLSMHIAAKHSEVHDAMVESAMRQDFMFNTAPKSKPKPEPKSKPKEDMTVTTSNDDILVALKGTMKGIAEAIHTATPVAESAPVQQTLPEVPPAQPQVTEETVKRACVGLECIRDSLEALTKSVTNPEGTDAPVDKQEEPVHDNHAHGPEHIAKVTTAMALDRMIACPDCSRVLRRKVAGHFSELFPNMLMRSRDTEEPHDRALPEETQGTTTEDQAHGERATDTASNGDEGRPAVTEETQDANETAEEETATDGATIANDAIGSTGTDGAANETTSADREPATDISNSASATGTDTTIPKANAASADGDTNAMATGTGNGSTATDNTGATTTRKRNFRGI